MGGEAQSRVSPQVLFALAGVEVGVLGGAVLFVSLAATSFIARGSAWTVPNLLASVLYGRTVLRSSFGMPSLAGLALVIVMGGVIGCLFGILVAETPSRLRVLLLALVTALVWFYFSQALLWNRLGVLGGLYVSPAWSMVGHLAFGLVLGQYPSRLRALRRHFAPESPPEEPRAPGPPPEAAM